MITRTDLEEAIAECVGKRDPNANDCIKLAAFYTIKRELYPENEPLPSYSYATEPERTYDPLVDFPGDGELARLVDGRPQSEVWPILDDLVNTLSLLNPRLHDALIRKLKD